MNAWGVLCFVFLICFSCPNLIAQSGSRNQSSDEGSFGRLPFIFEANRGQTEETVEFLARGADYTVLLEADKTEIVLPPARLKGTEESIRPQIITIRFVGASYKAHLEPGQLLPGKSNYILGKQRSQWLFGIPV